MGGGGGKEGVVEGGRQWGGRADASAILDRFYNTTHYQEEGLNILHLSDRFLRKRIRDTV